MALLLALLLLQLVCLSSCAIQRATPEAGVGGFLAERRYVYDYHSFAEVHSGLNLTLKAQVSPLLSHCGSGFDRKSLKLDQ